MESLAYEMQESYGAWEMCNYLRGKSKSNETVPFLLENSWFAANDSPSKWDLFGHFPRLVDIPAR